MPTQLPRPRRPEGLSGACARATAGESCTPAEPFDGEPSADADLGMDITIVVPYGEPIDDLERFTDIFTSN